MNTLNLRPKFMSEETIKKPRVAICPRCKGERPLPDGKTQLIGLCNDCCRELEAELKDKAVPHPEPSRRLEKV